MATLDLHHDIEPVHQRQKPVYPTLTELRAAITAAGKAASYPTLDHMTRNDLIGACRTEGIALFPDD